MEGSLDTPLASTAATDSSDLGRVAREVGRSAKTVRRASTAPAVEPTALESLRQPSSSSVASSRPSLERRPSNISAIAASPKFSERIQEYSQEGGLRRAACHPAQEHAVETSPMGEQDAYMHSKMKYLRALATHHSDEAARVESAVGAAATEESCSGWFQDSEAKVPAIPGRGVPSFTLNLIHPPAHVLSQGFFIRLPFRLDEDEQGHQGSMGFVFTIINTMMGSTLLCLPWGFENAGILTGAAVTIGFGIVSFYTGALIIDWGATYPGPDSRFEEFGDLCEAYVGRLTKQIANVTSICILTGAACCYHVLMATNLQAVVLTLAHFCHSDISHAFCCGPQGGPTEYALSSLVVGLCTLPLLACDVSKLAALGSYGVVALVYNVFFLTGTAVVNIFGASQPTYTGRRGSVKLVGDLNDVGVFIGMMGLSLFVHSVLLPIAGSHAQLRTAPKIVKRDLGVAYFLTVLLYVAVGVVPALAFELGHNVLPEYRELGLQQLPQNALLAYAQSSWGALIGRALLVLQIGIVYPILVAVSRKQFCKGCLNQDSPRKATVTAFNLFVVTLTTLIAATFPHPGSVVGYVGTYTAIVYMLWLPLLVHLKASRRAGRSSPMLVFGNVVLGTVGTLVILMQFVV